MPARRGFSLIELVLVAAVIVVLAALLLPAVRSVRALAQRAQCLSNLREIGVAIRIYMDDGHGLYPTARQDGVPGVYGGQVHWFELLQSDLDGVNHDAFAAVDRRDLAGAGRNVIKDCPTRTPSGNVAYYGYGLNGCLLMPGRPHRSYWDLATGYRLDYREAQVDCRPQRMLVGDSPDWHVTVDNPKYPTRWDPGRHRAVANYLFCDFHVASLPPAEAALAASDPGHPP